MRRVLNIITSVHDGGLERHVYYIVSLKQSELLEHYVAVLTPRTENSLTDKYSLLGINIKYFNFDNRLRNFKSVPKNIAQVFKLAYFIRKNKIEVVHSHDFFPAFVSRVSVLTCFVFFFHKVKRIYITLHIVFLWLKPVHNFINRLLSFITSKIVCLSNAIKQYSLTNDKIKPGKYIIINTGVDTSKFIPNKDTGNEYCAKFGYSTRDFILGNIGVLSIRKGQIYLLNALNQLKGKYPNLKLLIIGGERSHEKEIAQGLYNFISENNLEDLVKIISPRDDVNLIYNIFDVFVMPSVTEGLSACAIEAMLMKRLCLFSDIEPFKELVTNGKEGFLFKNKDIDDLVEKLDYIISRYNELNNVKESAYNSVKDKYDVHNMVKKYEKLYLN